MNMGVLDKLMNQTFEELKWKLSNKGKDGIIVHTVHTGYYVKIPDVVRRCFFLSSSEKEVLYELISWVSTAPLADGVCKVTESHIQINAGLSLATVKNCLASLARKEFISIRSDLDSRNVYRIHDGNKNPYLLLSEYLHYLIKTSTKFWAENVFEYEQEVRISRGKKLFAQAVDRFCRSKDVYTPFVDELRLCIVLLDQGAPPSSVWELIETLYKSVKREVMSIYSQ
jgi:hypothetical protein